MSQHTAGTLVWCRDLSGNWSKAEVTSVQDGKLTVITENGEQLSGLKPEQAPLQNLDSDAAPDMTSLGFLHEPGVLWNLKSRYLKDKIYTYTGNILIAINPFAPLPHYYTPQAMSQYRDGEMGDLEPHVFAVASSAYRNMRLDKQGQAILITGESGAGKTETSKQIMSYLAFLGGYRGHGSGEASVEQKVLQSNPLLEAFGNAKTVRNNNSSRFGKYVEINFNSMGNITGAAIRTYLLERSRVVSVNNPERNYHAFYQLCSGATADERKRWRLKPAQDFHYLRQSTCFEIPGVSNAEEYRLTRSAMDAIGLVPELQDQVFQVVAAVLHLGNVNFKDGSGGQESSEVDAGCAEHLEAAAALLGVDKVLLERVLTTRVRHTLEGPITSPLTTKAAAETRDALAKILYSKLFDWLVERVNESIGEDVNAAASIGLLDIYGFESFTYNDLEQLCINLANEKLQQHFNQHVFKWDQAEYAKEGIQWNYIEFVDNQDVLDLIEGRLGILDLLDEQCRFAQATARDLANKLYGSTSVTSSPRFSRPAKSSGTTFSLEHYAGPVVYSTDNFLDKNKDFVISEQQKLMQDSLVQLVRQLFEDRAAASSPSPGTGRKASMKGFQFNSVSSQFKRQLGDLMGKLNAMAPHYVRCIKPNAANKPLTFNDAYSLAQLKCGGVMEAVRISSAGYQYRRPYQAFLDNFWQLLPSVREMRSPADKRTAALLASTGITDYKLGSSKVFLRSSHYALLLKLRTQALVAAVTVVQKNLRACLQARAYQQQRAAIIQLQTAARGLLARRELQRRRERRAATIIQARWRCYTATKQYQRTRHSILVLQSGVRGMAARKRARALRREKAAVMVQSLWRSRQARVAFHYTLQRHRAAVVFQTAWRAREARVSIGDQLRRMFAARTIQRCWRHHHTWKNLHNRVVVLKAVLTIQRVWRELRRSTRMQRKFRDVVYTALAKERAALIVQTFYRSLAARRWYEMRQKQQRQERLRKFIQVFESSAPPQVGPAPPRPTAPQQRKNGSHTIKSDRLMRGSSVDGGEISGASTELRDVVRSEVHLDEKERLASRLQDIPRDLKVSVLIELWHDLTSRSDSRRSHSGGKSTFSDFIDTWILRKKPDSGSEPGSSEENSEAGSNRQLVRGSSRNGASSSHRDSHNSQSSGRVLAVLSRYMYPSARQAVRVRQQDHGGLQEGV